MTNPSFDPISAYLREHSPRYSPQALREQLVQSGYDSGVVDEAIAAYRLEHSLTGPHVFPKALLVVGVNALLIVGMLILEKRLKGRAENFIPSLFRFLVIAELVAGLVAHSRAGSRSWGRALFLGFALSIALGILALGWYCLFNFKLH